MANGYLHITRDDLVAGDGGVIYWKNGGRILGEVVSCIDGNDDVHYYLKTTNIKKAILIDAFVPVGVNDYMLYSDSANFINVQINTEDFTDIGGGAGISITFLLPEGKYYTVKYVEANGDIKIFDPAGDGGETGGGGLPDPTGASEGDVLTIGADGPEWKSKTLYHHQIEMHYSDTDYQVRFSFELITEGSTALSYGEIKAYLVSLGLNNASNGIVASGVWRTTSTLFIGTDVFVSSNYNIAFNGIETSTGQMTYKAMPLNSGVRDLVIPV